ncbi:hypothetical protein F5B19DRAFT_184047 [Rostrohypoxylon terebratum]|nr:hypothetical protein F5B19DRAFT_184047 [Rostrohypoxylon terebratum]
MWNPLVIPFRVWVVVAHLPILIITFFSHLFFACPPNVPGAYLTLECSLDMWLRQGRYTLHIASTDGWGSI